MRNFIEQNRSSKKKMIVTFIILSVIVIISVIVLLIRPAYSAVNNADCGFIEHTHTSECYSEHKNYGEAVLVCCSDISSETISHIHDEFCCDENGKIICPLSEYQHIHTDDCFDENGVQICGMAYHQHSKECFRVLGENESALVLDCGKGSHTHTESCYPELSPAPQEETQEDEDFEVAQSIEPYFEETEIIEPEIDNGIALFDNEQAVDVDATQGFMLEEANITSVTLQYQNAKGTWVDVTADMQNVPANTEMRFEVKYTVNKSDVTNNNNQIVYSGIPAWLNPDSTGNIYDQNDTVVATLSVGNGNAVITFEESFINKLHDDTSKIEGTFSVEGSADWREIENSDEDITLPGLDFNIQFEDGLPAKYGSFKVEKRHAAKPVEVRDANGNITHTYLKYELKVKSLEGSTSIPNICLTDVLSTENWLNKSNVIAGNGYVGVNTTVSSLGSSEAGFNPYETVKYAENHVPETTTNGTVVLDNNNNLKWQIAELNPNEERTLVYYVELNEKYVGSGSAGTLRNEAKPESNGYKRESVRDEFIPKADADISKTQSNISYNAFGNGTISYTVRVTANPNNSYTITDAFIKDAFGSGMGNYVKADQQVDITITSSKGTVSQTTVTIDSQGFNVPVNELQPGETLTITYSLELQQLFSHSNGDVSFTNHAALVGGNKDGKLKKGYTFKSNGATTYITHNQWMRKMNGQTVDTDRTVTIPNNGENVYNYDKSKSSATEFTVPQNAQEYTVIVNEDGTWNMSNTNFKDDFHDTRIAYTGYLKIEEFNKLSSIGTGNDLSDNEVLHNLNEATPNKTVYVDIDGRSGFDIKPQNYGLTNANKVYRLTYYAAVNKNVSNVKNIIVANNFSITGDIGYGNGYIRLNGIYTAVSSTLVSSASYEFDKESLFYENVYNHEYTGEIYWLIRANGTLTKDMHIQDLPTDTAIRPDSMIGVYIGDKDYDFSQFTSFNELNDALSEMEVCSVGTNKYFYNLQSISSSAYLNGKDFAIFSRKKIVVMQAI